MTLYKGNKVIAGSRSYIGNIGDIKYTTRVDLPFGGSWCDGSIKLKAQYPTVYQMLIDGKLQALDIATYESTLNLNGSCGFFGLDTATESFRVPSLNDVYIKSGQVADEFGAESLPNITGEINIGDSSGPSSSASGAFEAVNGDIQATGWDQDEQRAVFTFDASRVSQTYQDGAKVNPDHVKYRAYVVLYTGIDTNVDITKEIQLNNPFSFGMSQWLDSDPKNASWLLSDGAFHSGAIYESFYNWLVREYNNPDSLPKKVNANVVGNPIISNGVVSGFSTSNHLRIPDQLSAENNEWEIVIGLTTGDSVGGSYNQVFYTGGYNSSNRAIWAYIDKDTNRFGVGLGSGGSEWVSYLAGTSAILPNTKYLIRVSKKTNKYTLEISTDNGLTYNLEASLDATFSLPTYTPYFGMYVGSTNDYSFKGSIDLSQSYVKINNETWWRGFANNVKKASELYDDYDYIINTESRTFRLPLLDGSESIPDYNNKITISVLPYISSTKGFVTFHPSGNSNSVAVYVNGIEVGLGSNSGADSNAYFEVRKGDVITCSTNVNPDHSFLYPYIGNGSLYFYVGETVQDANLINASKVLDLLAKLESYDYVVESKTPTADDPSWYRVYKSGWVEQGGITPRIYWRGYGDSATVSLIKPMRDTGYSISATMGDNTSSWNCPGCRAFPVDAYSIIVGVASQGGDQGTCTLRWEVKGQGT